MVKRKNLHLIGDDRADVERLVTKLEGAGAGFRLHPGLAGEALRIARYLGRLLPPRSRIHDKEVPPAA
jgi:hypothetical protein